MLEFRDFFHLPQLDPQIEAMIADRQGLAVVAGLDLRSRDLPERYHTFRPSGRSTVLRMLLDQYLERNPSATCMIVAEDKEFYPVRRRLRNRVELLLVKPPYSYSGRISSAIEKRPNLLVVDRLINDSTPSVLEAAGQGLKVFSQLDTVLWGAPAARQLLEHGISPGQLSAVRWILTVQRMAALCRSCRTPQNADPRQLERIRQLFQVESAEEAAPVFYRAGGCPKCRFTGRLGDIAAYDVFQASDSVGEIFDQPSVLSLESYLYRLACLGHLPLEDCIYFRTDQFSRTYNLLRSREQALSETTSAFERKLAELEAANRVLQRRTQSLISLQEIGQALISSTKLSDLSARVCRRVSDLCGADYVILYLLRQAEQQGSDQRSPQQVEVISVVGWNPGLIHRKLGKTEVFSARPVKGPEPFDQWPPGVPRQAGSGEEKVELQAGLSVPLYADEHQIGLMIVQSTKKKRFAQSEVALLQTLANQAAMAMQRARLIDELRAKIDQLEAAQAGLAKKERMERELELARQVQQSVLPRTFPQVPGYRFAAQNLPARQVGGDFYDVISLDEDRFGLAVADVADKGMPAALVMALTRSLLLAESRRGHPPRQMLTSINQLLMELGEPGMFVTLFYGVVERSTGRFTYARAGHDYPILMRDGTLVSLGGQGNPLGIFDGDEFNLTEEQIVLAPGDRLVLYTDGLIDIVGMQGQPFGLERLRTLLLACAGQEPDRFCESIFTELAAFQGSAEQYDDMTLLVMEVERTGSLPK